MSSVVIRETTVGRLHLAGLARRVPRDLVVPVKTEVDTTDDGGLLVVWGHRGVLDVNPWLASRTVLRKRHLMSRCKPVVTYVRHRKYGSEWLEVGRIDMYDSRRAVPYVKTEVERKREARRRSRLRMRKTCPLCGTVVKRFHDLHGRTVYDELGGSVYVSSHLVRIVGDDGVPHEMDVCDGCLERLRAQMVVPPAPDSVPATVVLDTETTGLSPAMDELLSVGIVDLDGRPVWSCMVRPVRTFGWPEAEAVNGIAYVDVALAPTAAEIAPIVQSVVDRCDEVVGYNVGFDAGFLEHAGVDLSRVRVTDVMVPFAEVYGEWDDYHGDYRWQRLTDAADYYHYDWSQGPGAHDALADAAATAWVWSHMPHEDD